MSDPTRLELLQGTFDLLILRTLLLGPSHGHAIAKHIQRTDGAGGRPAARRFGLSHQHSGSIGRIEAGEIVLYQTGPHDPLTLAVAAASLLLAAILAGYLPASSAAKMTLCRRSATNKSGRRHS